MAKGISYSIAGKYNPKGEKDAISGINKITKAAKAFNMAVGGFVISKVFQGINKVVSGSTEEFKKNNTAFANFNKSVQNNLKLTQGAASRLQETIDSFSGNGLFGGDELNNAAALASQMKLNEEQIKNVMDAATEMSAAGIMPLDQAVKNLSASYSGNLGQLAKIAPELRNLTKEQLANGEAVTELKKNYDGFRDSMSSTFEGRDKAFEDAFGHLQESVGGIISGLKFSFQGSLLEPLHTAADFLEEHREDILKFFINLPAAFKVVVTAMWEMIKKTFTGAGFMNLIEYIGNSIAIMVKNVFPLIFEGVKTLFGTIGDLFNFTIGNAWRTMQDFFGKVGNKIIEVINNALYEVVNAPVFKQLYEAWGWIKGDHRKAIEFEAIEYRFKTDNSAKNKSWDDTKDSITKRFDQLLVDYKNGVKNGIKAQKQNFNEFASFYNEIMQNASEEIKVAINKELPEDLKKALDAGSKDNYNGNEDGNNTTPVIITDETANAAKNPFDEVFNNLGWIKDLRNLFNLASQQKSAIAAYNEGVQVFGESAIEVQGLAQAMEAAKAAMSGSIIGFIVQLIVQFVQALSNAAPAFKAFLDAISLFMNTIAKMIAPMINGIFLPLVQIIQNIAFSVGSLLVPIFNALNEILVPVFQLIAQVVNVLTPVFNILGTLLNIFIQLNPIINIFTTCIKILGDAFAAVYNYVFKPIVNFLLWIVSAIGNFFIGMYNKVIGVLRSINIFGWRPFGGLGYAQEINYDEIKLKDITWDSEGNQNQFDSGSGFNAADYSVNTGGTTGNSNTGSAASYTAARDIIMNIEIGNVVGQDGMREFSLMIRDEIKAAEALGR